MPIKRIFKATKNNGKDSYFFNVVQNLNFKTVH